MTALALANTGLPVLTDREFALFQRLIHREAGIWLADTKRALLIGRLARRLRELSLRSFIAYYRRVEAEPTELIRLLDLITTNETSFFRESTQIDCLADRLCPAWEREAMDGLRTRRLRVWSAACSTGEEPYTLGMVLHDRLAPLGWAIEIFASDISTRVIDQAESGVWSTGEISRIPARYLHRYWVRGNGPAGVHVRVGAELRRMVRFARLNLNAPLYAVNDPFDAIFCRNALIYFDVASRHQVLGRLLGHIAPAGYLFLGHAETLTGMGDRARSVMPSVYQLAGGAA